MICCNCRSTVLPKIKGKFDGFLMGFGKSKMLLLIKKTERDLIRICSVHGGEGGLTWWHCTAALRAVDLALWAHWS